ncbi:MAG: sulfate adenylyltransferase subunit CysD [Nitrospinota bacterium]|nr:sulfate adenylyltransferase subunit CysD [Nitrospinota bacterium]MDH5679774.1 sulfate adenylyltransferase subunit CysD [Nitrospinota bacterium]
MEKYSITSLKMLEAESIHIIREVAAEFNNPVMLYSVGKDSAVMAHLAIKAFYPAKVPFPLLHVDTSFKFPEMYSFRDKYCQENGLELRISSNRKALAEGVNPADHGTVKCCLALKTHGLLEAVREGGYDACFGGARREEEKSRAKERVYSFRDKHGQWDPKNQRPELWSLYNGSINKGESIRVFPLSNWTELDIWQYIQLERIPIVPLYLAKERQVVVREGQLIPLLKDTDLLPGEKAEMIMCRFRTLGCHHCTGAVRSTSETLEDVIMEVMVARTSERSTRVIDHDQSGSMEEKKKEGYF